MPSATSPALSQLIRMSWRSCPFPLRTQGPLDQVAIQGVGFSETAAKNTVKFNGVFDPRVSATVHSASPTKIVASVPIFASSGPISVTVGGATTTSSKDFTVTHTSSLLSGEAQDKFL